MDLQSEASSEKRILIARHISAEKAFDAPNNAVNTTFLCHSYTLQPDFRTYVEGNAIKEAFIEAGLHISTTRLLFKFLPGQNSSRSVIA